MARIWYSVCGEGYGHSIRSEAVISKISKNNKLIVTGFDKSYTYFKSKNLELYKLLGIDFVYEDNVFSYNKSVSKLLRKLPLLVTYNNPKVFRIIKKFKPDLIISDGEASAHYAANFYNIPILSIDNCQTILKCNVETLKEKPKKLDFLGSLICPEADYYIIPTFSKKIKTNKSNVSLCNPILNQDVLNLKSIETEKVLVYQTSPSYKKMIPVLKKSKNSFIIYGMGQKGKDKNLIFKSFSRKKFLNDLRSCKYIILNGGFSLISEALYLNKPIFSIPIKNQYEQEINAICIEKEGFGAYSEKIDLQKINSFEKNIEKYKSNIIKKVNFDQSKIFSKINKVIKQVAK